ncbi:MAG: beta-ketoacyl-[acyl-carrier-protein] synthase family protein [Elusimicrobia bacterium]|nr:beta-ketoacyl-[acyl-carrier-protein] synthase family protein [Candidatus Liberimonas magnetica]
MNKVVVTGIGLVTPLGFGLENSWKNLLESRSAVKPDKEYHGILSARINNLTVPDEVRLVSLAFLAASEAMKESDPETYEKFGCTVSISKPNLATSKSNELRFSDIFLQSTVNEQLCRIFKLQGPTRNIVAACATGTDSVILGAEWIKHGICDMVLAGSCESSFHPLYIAGFKQMGVLAKNKVCPFDKEREGFAVGEGAGILVLERKDRALLRGARIYGEILGYSMSNGAVNPVSFDPAGNVISQSIRQALEKANFVNLDYINAHGTATKLNDLIETRAIKNVFKDSAKNISVSSTKAATGHLLGASGAIELVFCFLAIRDKMIPPTLNLDTPDPECDLDYTPNKARNKLIRTAMSLSFGFGGQIGVIIVGNN